MGFFGFFISWVFLGREFFIGSWSSAGRIFFSGEHTYRVSSLAHVPLLLLTSRASCPRDFAPDVGGPQLAEICLITKVLTIQKPKCLKLNTERDDKTPKREMYDFTIKLNILKYKIFDGPKAESAENISKKIILHFYFA